MKILLLLFFLLIATLNNAFCQDKNSLSNFKFRTPSYKALNIGFNSNGGSQNLYNGLGSNRNFGAGINANYFAQKSTDKLLRSLNFFLFSNFNNNISNSVSGKNKNNSAFANPSVNFNNKWYHKSKFIEIGANLKANLMDRNSKSNGSISSTQSDTDNEIVNNLIVGVGKGRIENITDMQNALWLSKSLLNEKNLRNELSNSEVNELAKTITQSNYFRVLDARKRIRFVLHKIDSFLQTKNLIYKTDINYFTNLNDIVFFANNNPRQAGNIKFIRFISELKNSKRVQVNPFSSLGKKSNTNIQNTISFVVGFQKFKPLNLNQQFEYGISGGVSYFENKISNKESINNLVVNQVNQKLNGRLISTDYFVNYKLYPNTRTSVVFSVFGKNEYSVYDIVPSINTTLTLAASANYFISYNTTLFANVSERYSQVISQKSSSLQSNFYNLNLSFNTGLNIAF